MSEHRRCRPADIRFRCTARTQVRVPRSGARRRPRRVDLCPCGRSHRWQQARYHFQARGSMPRQVARRQTHLQTLPGTDSLGRSNRIGDHRVRRRRPHRSPIAVHRARAVLRRVLRVAARRPPLPRKRMVSFLPHGNLLSTAAGPAFQRPRHRVRSRVPQRGRRGHRVCQNRRHRFRWLTPHPRRERLRFLHKTQ